MLLRAAVLERIVRGEISLVFRRWRRPTVRAGGTLRIVGRLERLDARSPAGPWTARVLAMLAAIEAQPGVSARTLAEGLGCERDWLKPNVRKLKNLGLTVSLTAGYELSARGRIVLQRLRRTALAADSDPSSRHAGSGAAIRGPLTGDPRSTMIAGCAPLDIDDDVLRTVKELAVVRPSGAPGPTIELVNDLRD